MRGHSAPAGGAEPKGRASTESWNLEGSAAARHSRFMIHHGGQLWDQHVLYTAHEGNTVPADRADRQSCLAGAASFVLFCQAEWQGQSLTRPSPMRAGGKNRTHGYLPPGRRKGADLP